MQANKTEQGFSLIDVTIGMTVMMIGLMALTAAVAAGIVRNTEGAQQLVAKQYAASTLESIFSARDIGTLGFNAIANRSGCPNPLTAATGVFPLGVQPIMSQPGTDNVVATCDDAGTPIPGFTRQVTITDICDPERPSANCSVEKDGVAPGANPIMMKQVQVTIYYQGAGPRQLSITSQISNYAVDTQQ